jgi:hypothetical protein
MFLKCRQHGINIFIVFMVQNIVTYKTIVRQRIDKHVHAKTDS